MKRLRGLDWNLIREEAVTVGILMMAVLQTALFAADLAEGAGAVPEQIHFLGAVIWSWWYGYRVSNRRWK
jgi:ethanolamine utilization microcompartment shell protein EutS